MQKIFQCMAVLVILLSPGFMFGASKGGGSAITPERLRCEYRVNPLGIDATEPRLSWIVTSAERGQIQSAYRVLVASSRERLDREKGDLWDSGKIMSDETIHIEYGGKPLGSGMQCFWKVMVWDGKGRASGWSEAAVWSMGLLQESDWQAKWVGDETGLSARNWVRKVPAIVQQFLFSLLFLDKNVYLPSPYLRKSFDVQKPVRSAFVHVSALGLYELHLNGRRVGKDYFTPGWTDYDKRVYYLTYDVTDMIKPHVENVIGAILADGWYAGDIGWLGQRLYGAEKRLRLKLQIEFEDGTSQVVATDESWRLAYGPVLEAGILAGEVYDARLEMPGWSEPGFEDNGWEPVSVTEKVESLVQAYPGIPVRRTMEIKPVEMTEPEPGVFVFNMGQNFAGWARLRVKGNTGDKVVLRFGEMLKKDGTIYTANLRTARATDTYILKGGGEEIWEPRFTYHGFQYVEVTGYPGEPTLDSITGIAAHNDLPITGYLETSHPLVNKIYSNITWGRTSPDGPGSG